MSATVEGHLTESVPGSGTYDQYQATWKIGRFGGTTTSATIHLNGTVLYQSSSEFPTAELHVLQSNIVGTISGHHSGDLSIVLTHLRVTEESNPYWGEGFSMISYVSESGSGEGWTYNQLVSPGKVRLKGLSDNPLFGIVTATLDESELSRTLFLNIERVDLGLPPDRDLKIRAWGPQFASPGQTVSYIIELRNDGLWAARDVSLVHFIPLLTYFRTSTSSGAYDSVVHVARWDFEEVPPKSTQYLASQVELFWGLPIGVRLVNSAGIYETEEVDSLLCHASPPLSENAEIVLTVIETAAKALVYPPLIGEIATITEWVALNPMDPLIVWCVVKQKKAAVELRLEEYYYWNGVINLLKDIQADPAYLSNQGKTFEQAVQEIAQRHGYTPPGGTTEINTAHDPNIKYGPEGSVQPGQKLDYRVEYENEGEGIAFGVYFTDILDEDLDHSTLAIGPVIDVETGAQIAPPGYYNPTTRTITWFVGEVGPGQGGYADLSVNIRSDAPQETDIINYATVYFPSVPEITRTNAIVSIIPIPLGCVTGYVTADCPDPGAGLVDLVIDVNDSNGDLIASAITDANGYYEMCEIPVGYHTTTIVTPLGYSVSPEEVAITITGDDTVNVDFVLTCVEITASPRTIGFWKHQVGVATGGKGNAQIDGATLCDYLDLIENHFNSNAVNQVIVYQPPTSGFCEDKLLELKSLLNLKGSQLMIDRAKQQLMALLLNVASGKLSQTEIISVDSATVSQAITYCDNLIDDPEGDHEIAKTICDDINNNKQVAAGVIPLSTADIAYKQTQVPFSFNLAQNYPNPFNPTTEISFSLPMASEVKVEIFNILGQKVTTLQEQRLEAGEHIVRWDGSSVASGVYLYRLQAGDLVATKKMVLLK